MRMKQKFPKTTSIKFIKAVSLLRISALVRQKGESIIDQAAFLKTLQVKAKQQRASRHCDRC